MSIILAPDVEALIEREVASGRYESANDAVREGMELVAERSREARLEALRADIMAAEEQYNNGQFIEIKSEADLRELGERIKRRGRERLAAMK